MNIVAHLLNGSTIFYVKKNNNKSMQHFLFKRVDLFKVPIKNVLHATVTVLIIYYRSLFGY